MTERQGVEIDYCPKCRGIWLDRGELDKIIERSYAGSPGAEPISRDRDYHGYPEHGHGGPRRKKHKSWLSELFDFD